MHFTNIAITHEMCDIERCGYRIEKILGSGTYGIACEARDMYGRKICCKSIEYEKEDDTGYGVTELEEYHILSSFNHPNLIRSVKLSMNPNNSNLREKIVHFTQPGDHSLSRWMRGNRIPIEKMVSIAFDIINGMHYMHENKCLHLDIKPDNIIIYNADTSYYYAKIIDFSNSFCDVDDMIMGEKCSTDRITATYRAPEVFSFRSKEPLYGYHTDIWSFGILFLNLIRQEEIISSYCHDEEEIYNELCRIFFSNTLYISDIIPKSIENYNEILHKNIVSLVRSCTLKNPISRPNFSDLLSYPLFSIHGKKSYPILPSNKKIPKIESVYRGEWIRFIISIFKHGFPNAKVKALLLAIELLHRTMNKHIDVTYHYLNSKEIILSCIWIALKLNNNDNTYQLDASEFLVNIHCAICFIKNKIIDTHFLEKIKDIPISSILDYELDVINSVEGVLYLNYHYNLCETKRDLLLLFDTCFSDISTEMYYAMDTEKMETIQKTTSFSTLVGKQMPKKNVLVKDICNLFHFR
jgi:serine/threonine protein kinase